MRFGARWDFSCASAQGTLSRFVKHLLRCRCGHGLSSILRLGLLACAVITKCRYVKHKACAG